ncbi:MAG: porin [Pseudomonadota bacterium]|uniref:porin n=1 Tax=Alcanivorax sp. TaxID=1872427 RepID=UPI00243A6EF7|nr:porin [Alcanivorax sp.]MED5238461.1 porin [Pseudomonadota bacterium]MEE3319632.1 porin [Pseudomonadota bacterium]
MNYQRTLRLSSAVLASLAALPASAALEVTPYGSLRISTEAVSVDDAKPGEDDSYTALRDAYSRLGVTAAYNDLDWVDLNATVEFPINSALLRAEDPSFFQASYKGNNKPRVADITATTDNLGTLRVGTQWLAYYNTVAYPVDYFSSFYSGFATQATFRRDAATYTTPTIGGLTATVSAVDMTHEAGTNYLDSWQYALGWAIGDLTLGLAYQDTEQETGDNADQAGASLAYVIGGWRFAAKVEQLQSNIDGLQDEDPVTYNLYGSYSWNKYTVKAMFANGEETDDPAAFYQGDSYQVGLDYQYSENLKLFADYFYEELSYAIYTPNSRSFDTLAPYLAESDGQAFSLGLRYDF